MMGVLDLRDEPDEPRQVEHADTHGKDRPTPKPREMPDPDERNRAFEAMQAHVSAETWEAAEQSCQPDGISPCSYRTEVPRFGQMWAEHEKRWPEKCRPAEDPSRDASGPHHKDDSSERHAENIDVSGQVREAERKLSADMRAIQQENKYEGWLAGFEFRLKGEDRLREKISEGLTTATPDATPSQVLRLIPDAIRYTVCLKPESYTRGFYDIKELLESRGYEMYYCKNWWTNPEYKGINTRWVTPEGQRFETQFHTSDSSHAKHYVTHDGYKRIRDTATSRAELSELHAFQREVSSWIQVPDCAADIPDYRKEGF
jgi:hypothetical protein